MASAALKKQRTPLRTQLTKIHNSVNQLLIDKPGDLNHQLKASLDVSERIWSNLQEMDNKILEELTKEDAAETVTEKEYEERIEYEMKFFNVKSKVEEKLTPVIPQSPPSPTPSETPSSRGAHHHRVMALPKIELMKFDGDIKNWLQWRNQFTKIDEDPDLLLSDKVHYLFQSMKIDTEPYQLVHGYQQTNDNYETILKDLEERYGREDLLLQVYIRDLLKLVISNATNHNKIPLAELYLKIQAALRSLESLKVDQTLLATILFPLVESCLSFETLRAWQRSGESKKDGSKLVPKKTKLDLLMEFIKNEVQSDQQIALAKAGFSLGAEKVRKQADSQHKKREPFNRSKSKSSDVPTAAGLATTSSSPETCAFCDRKHDTIKCISAQKMSLEQRKSKIREGKRCLRCLEKGHWETKCRVPVKCVVCGDQHYPIMCPKLSESSGSSSLHQETEPTIATSNQTASHVLLNTLWVLIKGEDGTTRKARLFGDTGSQRSYIKSSVAQQVNAKLTGQEWLQTIVFGGGATEAKPLKRYFATLSGLDGKNDFQLSLLSENKICGQIPRVPPGPWIKQLSLKGIKLSDVGEGNEDVHILIGSDNWGHLLTGKTVKLNGGLVATETIFGWTLAGPVPGTSMAMSTINMSVTTPDISKLWQLETIGIQDPIQKQTQAEEDTAAWIHFRRHVTRKDNGYVVRLPWKDEVLHGSLRPVCLPATSSTGLGPLMERVVCPPNEEAVKHSSHGVCPPTTHCVCPLNSEAGQQSQQSVCLPSTKKTGKRAQNQVYVKNESRPSSNREIAEKRLISSRNKLSTGEKFNQYNDVFESWLKEGFIREVTNDDRDGHYLPHRPVFKESLTTPVRPVFDASCKTREGFSLNDALYKGPNLLEIIPSLLLRFREKKIGVTSDIRKAFQMVHVHPQDQKWQKFLWWKDSSYTDIKVFQHQRVIFGMNCSPFLLGAVIQHHLEAYFEESPTANTLHNSFYVDNCVTSVSTYPEYLQFRDEATEIMREANMELRQWAHSFLSEFGVGSAFKVGCGLNPEQSSKDFIEDREVISVLGLQWDRKADTLSCDVKIEKLCSDSVLTCRTMLSTLAQIFDPIGFTAPITITPKLLLQEAWNQKLGWDDVLPKNIQQQFLTWLQDLHYIRQIAIPRFFTLDDDVMEQELHVFCDASQSAYATAIFLKTITVTEVKVQLLSAKTRVAPMKKTSIPRLELMSCNIAVRQAEMVKDAVCLNGARAFYWNDSTTALAWIQRRGEWRVFVGNRTKEIRTHTQAYQWFHIPGVHNPADFPSRPQTASQILQSQWWEGPEWLRLPREEWPQSDQHEDEEEIKKELRKTAIAMPNVITQPPFSSHFKNVKVYLWAVHFINIIRKRMSKPPVEETLKSAERLFLKTIQYEAFSENPSMMYGLQIFRDSMGLYRVKSRLLNNDETENFIYPILLPNKHPAVRVLIEDMHLYYNHAGAQVLITKLREKYWVPQARRTVRGVIKKCNTCRRYDAKPLEVPTAPLPPQRTTTSNAFQTTGVDLAGPLILNDGSKAWIVIFTCAVYRGVYLDTVKNLSTEAFLGALERFIAIYGRPNTIFSDNGTNFVGASNIFKQLDWKDIEKESNIRQIQWVFNPPSAPWWGGWWERLIRSVKDQLRRMIGKAKLSYDGLRTCLSSVAATMNDRPLTAITEDNGDLIALTPNHFIRAKSAGILPETIDAAFLQKEYRKLKELQSRLQARFRKEYLSQIVMKANEGSTPPKVGDLVFIGSEGKKRFEWPIAKITKLFPGRDNEIRLAEVKTSKGFLLRPLQRLYPLEMPEESMQPPDNIQPPDAVPEIQVPEKTRRTRSGREIKKPQYYGQWVHLIN